MFKFTIPGAPTGKARPKFTRNGHTYTPDKTVNYENMVKLSFRQAYPGAEPYACGVPLMVTITAYFKIPASASKKKKELMLEDKVKPSVKPDWDNIGKIVCDALNGIAYYDDSQIVTATVDKIYSNTPSVEVLIEEMKL